SSRRWLSSVTVHLRQSREISSQLTEQSRRRSLMDELEIRARVLGARLGSEWSAQHVEASLVRLHATARTRSRRRMLASTGLGGACIVAIAVLFSRPQPHTTTPRVVHARPDRPHERRLAVNTALELDDGSRIVALADGTDVVTAQPSRRRVHVK